MRYLPRSLGAATGAVLLALLILPVVALAHANFVRSTPAPNSVVAGVPATVRATFSEAITTSGSAITVVGPGGVRADQGNGRVDLSDPSRTTMLVSLRPGLGPGTYTVNWTTISADDGEKASGSFAFTVGRTSTAVTALPRTGGGLTIVPLAGALSLLAVGLAMSRSKR